MPDFVLATKAVEIVSGTFKSRSPALAIRLVPKKEEERKIIDSIYGDGASIAQPPRVSVVVRSGDPLSAEAVLEAAEKISQDWDTIQSGSVVWVRY